MAWHANCNQFDMPRAKRIHTVQFVYHLTLRSNNKEWFYISPERCWSILCSTLGTAVTRYRSDIHALVQMSNHLHLLISTPEKNVSDVMRYFISIATQWIQRESGRINHIFGARYKSTILDSSYSLAYVYKYLYRNPVRGGLSETVQTYPFSTLNDLSGLPIVEGFSSYWKFIPKNYQERINWLNIPTAKEQEELISRALKHPKFQFTTNSNFQRNLRGLKENYGVENVQ